MIDRFGPGGLIGYKGANNKWDFGDSAQRHGSYHLLTWAHRMLKLPLDQSIYPHGYYPDYIKGLEKLMVGSKLIRHPSPGWWSDTDRGSRDQYTPILIMAAIYKGKRLRQLFWDHAKRLFLFTTNVRRNWVTKANHGTTPYTSGPQTPGRFDQFILKNSIPIVPVDKHFRNYNWKPADFTGPEIWAIYARGFGYWWLRPLVWLGDVHTYLDTLAKAKNKDKDLSNTLNILIFTMLYKPSWLTKKSIMLLDMENVKSRLKQYYTGGDSVTWVKLYMRVLSALRS